MSRLIELGKEFKLADGSMKEVMAGDLEILIARVADRYYAADNHCPHFGGKLSEGQLNGTIVTCPRHGSQFNLTDGSVVRWLKGSGLTSTIGRVFKSPRPLRTHSVKVEEGRISVEI